LFLKLPPFIIDVITPNELNITAYRPKTAYLVVLWLIMLEVEEL